MYEQGSKFFTEANCSILTLELGFRVLLFEVKSTRKWREDVVVSSKYRPSVAMATTFCSTAHAPPQNYTQTQQQNQGAMHGGNSFLQWITKILNYAVFPYIFDLIENLSFAIKEKSERIPTNLVCLFIEIIFKVSRYV